MNIETLELIHKLLTEHKDNASRCCDRARGKRNSTQTTIRTTNATT